MGANIQAAIFHVFDLNLGTPEGSHTPVWCHQRIHFQVLPPRLSHLCFFLLSFHQSTYLFISLSCTPFNPMNYFESGNLIELSMYKQCIMKSRDVTLPTKVHLVKAMVFPVVMYGCDNWTVKKAERRRIDAFYLWCWRRLLTARRSNQSILKSWVFIGRTDAEGETLILWPPDAKSWLIGKDPDAGKDWGQEEKLTIEDEMVRWHHQLNGCEFG